MTSQMRLSPQYQQWKTRRLLKEKAPCKCGCGKLATYGNRFIHGHQNQKIWIPFDEAKKIARSLNLNSEKGYRKLKRQGKLPKELTGHPDRVYKDKGWANWYDYLGNEPPTKPLPFEKAKEIIRDLGIKGKDNHLRLYKERKLPKGLPSDPPKRYKNKGWISWTDYFGSEPYHIKALEFEKAKEIVRSLGIKSISEYLELLEQGKFPKGIPSHPERAYRDKGWISWYEFLGKEQIKLLPFEKAREIVLTLNIRSKIKYLELYREKKLPPGLPNDPYDAYIDRGWTSWSDFLGHELQIKPLPFEDARRIARSLGCRTSEEYQRLLRQDKLPKGMPRSPKDTYKNKGWANWYDYLGNEPPTKPLPFKEAIKIVRKLGIKGKEEYQRLHTESKLPKGLPYEPDEVYAKERIEG